MKFLMSRLKCPDSVKSEIFEFFWVPALEQIQGFLRDADASLQPLSQVWGPGRGQEVWWTGIFEQEVSLEPLEAAAALSRLAAAHRLTTLTIGQGDLEEGTPAFHQPIIILAAPRSGSTLLYELLSSCKDCWTIGDESHNVIDRAPQLEKAYRDLGSNRLDAGRVDAHLARIMRARFAGLLRDRDGRWYPELAPDERPAQIRFLEKTPKNAFRIPFLRAIYPDARFIYLYRDARENISSIIDAWRSGHFVAYPELPGWDGPPWSLLLPPGWQEVRGRPLEEIAAFQWGMANQYILDDLAELPPESWRAVSYAELLSSPHDVLSSLCRSMDLTWDERLEALCNRELRPSGTVLTRPEPDKWRRHAGELERVLPKVSHVIERVEMLGEPSAPTAAPGT